MSQEITKQLMCILMRDGMEVFIENEKLEPLMTLLENKRFIRIEDKVINTADITGIYSAKDVEERNRRKNGEWQCKDCGRWHNKGEQCGCSGGRY